MSDTSSTHGREPEPNEFYDPVNRLSEGQVDGKVESSGAGGFVGRYEDEKGYGLGYDYGSTHSDNMGVGATGSKTASLGEGGTMAAFLKMFELMERNRIAGEERMMRLIENLPNRTDTPKDFHIMPDFSKGIEVFDGEVTDSSGGQWLEKLIGMGKLHS